MIGQSKRFEMVRARKSLIPLSNSPEAHRSGWIFFIYIFFYFFLMSGQEASRDAISGCVICGVIWGNRGKGMEPKGWQGHVLFKYSRYTKEELCSYLNHSSTGLKRPISYYYIAEIGSIENQLIKILISNVIRIL